MFLDDKLYNYTVNRKLNGATDFRLMINELYKISEDHYKSNLHTGMSYKQGKIMMDRTFNSWDLFIGRLDKEDYFLIDFIKEASFKKVFMENKKLKEIYEKGK